MKRIILLLGLLLFYIAVSLQAQTLQFAFLTDLHVSPNAPSNEALNAIVNEINAERLNFVLITGDLTNTGSDAELNAVKQAVSQLTIPYYIVSGNHETNWSESAGATFTKLWQNDRFLVEQGKYVFVGLSTGPYMKMGDGHVKEEDIDWLKQQLVLHGNENKTLIFAAHYPLTADLDNWYKVTEVLKKYNARLALCGHGHKLSLHNFDTIIGVMGRATVKKESPLAGYNIVKLQNDSAFIYDKEVGVLLSKPAIAISLKNNDIITSLPTSALPDYSENKLYPQVKIAASIQDTASIFTGVTLLKNNMLVYGNSKGEVVAYKTDNNKPLLLWKKQYAGSVYATPVADNNMVYVGTIDGYLHALYIDNGTEKWSLNLGLPIIGEGVIEKNNLYIGSGNCLYKIDASTGKVIWKNTDIKGQLQGKPTLTDKYIVFGAWDRHLYCVNKTDGTTQWTWNNGHQAVLYSPANVVPAVHNEKVFIVAPDRYMTAIDLTNGKTIWRTNANKVRESMGVSADGKTVYAKLMNDSIIAVSTTANQYQQEWAVNAGFGYEHNPCPIIEHNGIVYAGGKNGLVVAIDKKTHQIKWKHKCGNSSINKITPDGTNGVWVSLIEGKIVHLKN